MTISPCTRNMRSKHIQKICCGTYRECHLKSSWFNKAVVEGKLRFVRGVDHIWNGDIDRLSWRTRMPSPTEDAVRSKKNQEFSNVFQFIGNKFNKKRCYLYLWPSDGYHRDFCCLKSNYFCFNFQCLIDRWITATEHQSGSEHEIWIALENTLQKCIAGFTWIFDAAGRILARYQCLLIWLLNFIGHHWLDLFQGAVILYFWFFHLSKNEHWRFWSISLGSPHIETTLKIQYLRCPYSQTCTVCNTVKTKMIQNL